MSKPKIIYIHGNLGAGKTSTANRLAEELGYERVSAGFFFREEAKNRGMDFPEFHELLKRDQSIDLKIDQHQKEYMLERSSSGIIGDGRIGFYLIPEAFNVFLDLDMNIATSRILDDMKTNEGRSVEKARTLEGVLQETKKRTDDNRIVLRNLYGVEDCFDHSHFDLVVNTGKNNLEQVVEIVKTAYLQWREE